MTAPGYEHLTDGDSVVINTKTTNLKLCCCDCGLVHNIPLTVVQKNGKLTRKIRMTFNRDDRATNLIRKRKKGAIL